MGAFSPSVSAAWNVTEEDFMKRFPLVNNLKVRVGYGLAGNQSGDKLVHDLASGAAQRGSTCGQRSCGVLERIEKYESRFEMGSEA